MTKFKTSYLKELFNRFKDQRIAVIGDLMLDRYMWGAVYRISPEAPVPVVEVASETEKLGGAANVANNLATLGARAIPIGVVGDDLSGKHVRELFDNMGMEVDAIVTDPYRPTTVKTRIIANDQHVVRADVESMSDLSEIAEHVLLDNVRKKIPHIHGVILEDYNKGVLTPRLISEIVSLCQEYNVFVAVDPKFRNFFSYTGVNLFKPNTKETEQVLGVKIESEADLLAAAQSLFQRLSCHSILITRGEKGMSLFPAPNEAPLHVPTHAKKIHDVSGAGDTVIATLVVAHLAGATLMEAATLANYAAGIVCGEVGVVPIDHKALYDEIMHDALG